MAKQATTQKNATQPQNEQSQQFGIQRIYVKDLSFEAPNSPELFKLQEWRPEISLDLQTQTNVVEPQTHEVVLTITVTAKVGEKTAFLVEVKQAGIFTLGGFPENDLRHMLGSFCPNILFPYAREAISNLIDRGGFPHIYLAPVNFEALYQQHLEQH